MLYSRAELKSIFTGSGIIAQKLFLENPELYYTMRAEAVAQGILGPSAIGTPAPYTTGKPQKSYSEREMFLRAKYSLEELKTFFRSNNTGSKENPSTLFRTNPAEYAERREAAVSYGLLPSTPSTPQRTPQARTTEPQPGSGETFELDPRICKELSLPEGFKVNSEGYYRAIQAVKNAAASKAVAAEKARLEQEAAANKDNDVQPE